MSVIKKQFTWKFGYPLFQKKFKLNFEKEEEEFEKPGEFTWDERDSCSGLVITAAPEDVSWDFGDKRTDADKTESVITEVKTNGTQAPEPVQDSEVGLQEDRIYCNLVELSENPLYENQRSQDVGREHLYENAKSEEPLYENCSVSVSEDKEHIYEHVSYQSPVNIFLGLLQSETETISPDPNIYEVPPGAIFNTNLVSIDDSDTRKLKPPEGFQDYENICWNPQTEFDEEIFALPVEVIYSTVVKPKRKKCRPHVSVLLREEGNASFSSVKGANNEMSGVTNVDMNNKNGFSGAENAGSHIQNTNCNASSEHDSNHTQISCDDASSKGSAISHKANGTGVSFADMPSDNITSCEDKKNNTTIDNCITSHEDNSVDTTVNNCVDPSQYSPIKANDNLLNSFEEDKTGIPECLDKIDDMIDNSVASCGNDTDNTKLDNCITSCGNDTDNTKSDNCITSCGCNFVDIKVDKHTISCGEAEKLTEGHNCINSCKPESVHTRVVISCENSSKDIDIQDPTMLYAENSNDTSIEASANNAIDNNIDKRLPACEDFKKFVENDTAAITCGDSSDNGEGAEVRSCSSNEISGSINEIFPKSTVITKENTGNESETKIRDIPDKNYENVNAGELEEASVIEISEDGTWETRTLPSTELGQANQEDEGHNTEEPEFLCAVDRSVETVKMAYGSQYYVNCPVASVKPMRHENAPGEGDDDTVRNIGAQIMKKYEEEKQKLRENLPDVSLLDVDSSLEDIQRERRRIIENQAVRAKRIDSWIKSGKHPGEVPVELLELENVSLIEGSNLDSPLSTITDFVVSVSDSGDTTTVDMETCVSASATKLPAEGEVVYDSIIQNKHKTKSYWEQLMMAAATTEQPRLPFKRDFLSLGSDGEDGKPSSDVSEQEYYDARSQISLHSPAEPLDSLDQTYDLTSSGPKIVETVSKKLMEAETVKLNKSIGEESVIEKEIRLQREREEALAREREEALLMAAALPPDHVVETSTPSPPVSTITATYTSPNAAETKIALELREMREREEELRRLRQRLSKEEADDGFNSIPNTDEGNFSEYGSEEKELSLDGNSSRMMSPEVPAGPEAFLHQRTQSMDSMSSGHSSGSGSGSGNIDMIASRRRITVKPLDEPDDEEIPSYKMRNQKETPIEREIRLAREREEELRREKRLPPLISQPSPPTGKQEIRRINSRNTLTNDSRSVQHRLATSRIQHEIDEATEREKELQEAGMIQTMSEETVDSKVTRFTDLAEFAIEEQDRKLQKSISTSHVPQSVDEMDGQTSISHNFVQKIQNNIGSARGHRTIGRTMSQSPSTPTLSPRKFPSSLGQKGLMERFLATRGKMGTLSSGFVTGTTSPTPGPLPAPPVTTNKLADMSLDERQNIQESDERENGDIQRAVFRRGYISAEEKMKVEMQEMQKREEELRLQRARMFARSQPNLLCLGDEEEEEGHTIDRDMENHIPLRTALSNPNLLDSETTSNGDSNSVDKPSFRTIRKQNALIAQWENMIQQNIEH